jgi:hypothetical protein
MARPCRASFASESQVVGKFMKFARHALPVASAERLVALLLKLEHVQDGREILRALAAPYPERRH